jgi:metal transporter CNNM
MTSRSRAAAGRHSSNAYTSTRPAVLGLAKLIVLGLSQLSITTAAPLKRYLHINDEELPEIEDQSLWLYLTTALILVLLGGAFAGLTIA